MQSGRSVYLVQGEVRTRDQVESRSHTTQIKEKRLLVYSAHKDEERFQVAYLG